MESTPKISVVTATRNRRNCLGRCIESIATQDYPNKEHIIIDGGSTDGAVDLIKEYAERYPHIRWISEKDDGLSQAFNKGLARVTGELVGVLNDDDHYLPGAFAAVAQASAAHPDAGLFAGHCDQVGADGSLQVTIQSRFTDRRSLIACWQHWGYDIAIPAPSTFIRKSALDKTTGFHEADKYAMDYRLWIDLTAHTSVQIIDRTLAVYLYDEGTISYQMSRKQQAETLAISRDYWGPTLSPSFWRYAGSYGLHQVRRVGRGLSRVAARSRANASQTPKASEQAV